MVVVQKELCIGAVGAGRMGKVHINSLCKTRNVNLVAVCTVVEAEKQWIRENVPNARIYDSFDEFVAQSDIDAIWISGSTHFHEEHLSKALANGKHVCCEKPLSHHKNIAWKMYEQSLKYPHLKAGCAFPRRFSKVYQEARKAIAKGTIGDVIAVRSSSSDLYNPDREQLFKFLRTSGGIFLDMNAHDLDISLFLAGKDSVPETAFAVGTREVYPETAEWNDCDNACGIIRLSNGLVFNTYASRDNRHGSHPTTEIVGTKGRIVVNPEPRGVNVDISTENGTTMVGAAEHWDFFEDGFAREVEAFRDWILYDSEDHAFSLKDAATAVSLAHNLTESFIKNSSVPVKLVD
ncbi:hypothetical protein TRICI_002707 [Trichomonascus ciferrii]|uniref:Gfo/Idh/MocA-like oxidoreductase N-terminal domain-containing protein n=1 Tax=Trichomonascus ciferrii TaxID=44093 RepID=A0A642VBS9_9ASCO|nr:hypothetical protein TRICI_002707 [Trichomonascus ciferrii]